MELHDEHYKKAGENLGVEPVDVMEAILLNNVPNELKLTVLCNFRSAMMYKYQSRLGLKDDIGKEIEKIHNWCNRLKTGKFLKEGK